MTTPTTIEPSRLPATIRDYLAAHGAGDTDAALRTFAPTAQVVDDGHTFRGTEEIRRFLTKAGSEFTYTTELIGAQRIDDDRWVAVNRLEGDFPGGVVELHYRFALAGDLVVGLTIAPE
ncbi:MAG: nuclear transport factor 2 family protein [Aeromicrobium sp.]